MPELSDLLELLEADHRRIQRLVGEGQTGASLVAELSSHIVAEHQLLHPALRDHLAGGDAAADALTDIDHSLERALGRLEDGEAGVDREEIATLFARHVAGQEELFPEVRRAVDPERLQELGQQLGPTLSEAPTHPHPNLPEEGPLEVIGDAVASSLDQLRDALRRRGR